MNLKNINLRFKYFDILKLKYELVTDPMTVYTPAQPTDF